MIRREHELGWLLINQYDHALLSGEIMKYWGNDAAEPPDPYDEVLFAISEHDNGWLEWDSSPRVYPQNNYPMNFMEMNFQDQEAIWRRSYERHSSDHPYASALIALHFRVFNQKIIDKNDGRGDSERLNIEMNRFIARTLNLESSNSSLGKLPEKVNLNLRLVQVGDILSLALCHGWDFIEIPDAPSSYSGTSIKLSLSSKDGRNFAIDPYPFWQSRIEFKIRGIKLEQKIFENDKELRQKLNESDYEKIDFLIHN